jgi:hypothetical protein
MFNIIRCMRNYIDRFDRFDSIHISFCGWGSTHCEISQWVVTEPHLQGFSAGTSVSVHRQAKLHTIQYIYIRIYTWMYVYIILYSNIYTYILYRSTHTVKHMSIHIRWIGRAFLDGATLWRHFLPINSYKQLSFCLADSWELSVTDFSHCNVSDPIIKYTVKDLPQGTAQSESESTRPGKIEWAAIDEDRRKYGCQAGGSTRSRSNNCMDFF